MAALTALKLHHHDYIIINLYSMIGVKILSPNPPHCFVILKIIKYIYIVTVDSMTRVKLLLLHKHHIHHIQPCRLFTREISSNRSTTPTKMTNTLELLTASTPNGYKVTIALEELKLVGAIPGYEFKGISFAKSEQKEDWFLKVNPNGRIPALIDHRGGEKGDINVWESASILQYLARVYDKKFNFHFEDEDEEQEMTNWIYFIQGGLGPMQGQANHFVKYAPEKVPYAIKRYQDETKRLYGVYNKHLAKGDREYLVGSGKGKFSYADICTEPWVRAHSWCEVPMDDFPHLEKWVARIEAREGVKNGLKIPSQDLLTKFKDDPKAAAEHAKASSAWIMQGLAKDEEARKQGKI